MTRLDHMTRPGTFRATLESGTFTVTAEIGPPRGADPGAIERKVAPLRGWVTAVNITDNQGASVRLANWAGSLAALGAGVEPIMQLTCRDRNRIALQSDLLGASARLEFACLGEHLAMTLDGLPHLGETRALHRAHGENWWQP